MARNDRDRDSPSERREYHDQRGAQTDPIRAATPSAAQVQRESERVALNQGSPSTPQITGNSGGNRWAGHNQNADGVAQSISSMAGDEKRNDQPNHVVAGERPRDPEPDPEPGPSPAEPAPSEDPKSKTGRSKQRQSTLALDKSRTPEGQTKRDARREKTSRMPERDRQKRTPEGQNESDARSKRKQEVVCKAPPRGQEAKPKGAGGSGKRFVPYIGSKACK